MSRAALVVMHIEDGGYAPVDDGPAAEALDAYFAGPQGQTQMLHTTGVALTVAGEAYHVYHAAEDQWHTLADDAVTANRQGISFKIDGRTVKKSPADIVVRLWNPHPRNPYAADSPVRSNLGTLEEVRRLTDHIASQLDSRLSGAGVLFLPSEIQFAAPDGADPDAPAADTFMLALGEAMMAALERRGSAAEKVPLVVTAPGDSLDKVKHLTFWTPLDAAAGSMRDSAVKRLALGMDAPPEILLGVGDSNHWNAWIVDEAAIKAHIEPPLAVVANAITTAYVQPALEGVVPDPQNYIVAADTSQIRLRPNRATEAVELYDRGELNGDALRRETGFDPADRPGEQELRTWLLRKVATGSTSPEQTVAALRILGADLGIEPDGGENRPPGDDMRTDARRRVRDARRPDIPRAVAEKEQRDTALSAACEPLVLHALTRAGNKLTTAQTRDGLAGVSPHLRHTRCPGQPDRLLDGAWEFAAETLHGVHPNPAAVVTVLDGYARSLLTARAPHTREALAAAIAPVAEAS
jgi:hypothetical protein